MLPLTSAITSLRPPTADSLDGRHFHAPALRFGVARVHAEDFGREQRGFVATRAGADFEHDVLVVERVFRKQQHLQLFFDAHQFRFQPRDFIGGHLAEFRIGILNHGARFVVIILGELVVAVFADHFFQLRTRLGDFAIGVAIGNDSRVRHLAGHLVKPCLDIVEPLRKLHGGFQRASNAR